jgi:D-3-phosphoglycerate dehydrogenase
MINSDAMAKMKNGVILLNFARDALVDDDALEAALKTGKVKRYVTDFPNDRTAGMEGVIAIPHLGASTEESEDNCAVMAVNQLMDFIENGNTVNSVNFPNVSCERSGGTRICVLHKNIPNMISVMASSCGELGLNIEHMQSKSKGDISYAIIDLTDKIDAAAIVAKLQAVDGIMNVSTR